MLNKVYIEYLNFVGNVGFGYLVNVLVMELGCIVWVCVSVKL